MNGGTSALVVGVDSTKQWFVISLPVAPNGIGWVAGSAVTVYKCRELSRCRGTPSSAFRCDGTTRVPPTRRRPCWLKQWSAPVLAPLTLPTALPRLVQTGWVLGKSADNQWWMVRLDPTKVGAGNGWISATFVSTSNTDNVPVVQVTGAGTLPPSQVAPPPAVPGAPLITTTDYVNLRSGPGTNYPVVGYAAAGATTTPTGISADGAWFQFAVPNTFYVTGYLWVSASFVVAVNTANLPVVNAPPPPRGSHNPTQPTQPPAIAPSFRRRRAMADRTVPGHRVYGHMGVEEHRDKCLGGWAKQILFSREPSITSGSARGTMCSISPIQSTPVKH